MIDTAHKTLIEKNVDTWKAFFLPLFLDRRRVITHSDEEIVVIRYVEYVVGRRELSAKIGPAASLRTPGGRGEKEQTVCV